MLFYNIISLFSTFVVVCLFLHLRINRKRIEISLIDENIKDYHNIFLLLLCCSIIIILYLLVLQQLTKNKSNFWDKRLHWFKFLQKYNVFYRAYSLIFDYLGPNFTIYFIKFAKKFVEYNQSKNVVFISIFVVSPRLFIVILLFLEILLMKNIHYYFYSLILLIVPLFFRLFVFIFKDLSPRLLPEFEKFLELDIKQSTSNSSTKSSENSHKIESIGFRLKPEYEYMDIDDLLYNFYYPLLYLRGHMDVYFLPLYQKINIYTVYAYYICHVIVWAYLLILTIT